MVSVQAAVLLHEYQWRKRHEVSVRKATATTTACSVKCEPWLRVGYALLNDLPPVPRDYLILIPSSNCQGANEENCGTTRAVRFETAFSVS